MPKSILLTALAVSILGNVTLGWMAVPAIGLDGPPVKAEPAAAEVPPYDGRDGEIIVGMIRDGELREIFAGRDVAPNRQPFRMRTPSRDTVELTLDLTVSGDLWPLPELPLMECLNHYRFTLARVKGQEDLWNLNATIIGGPIGQDKQCLKPKPPEHPA